MSEKEEIYVEKVIQQKEFENWVSVNLPKDCPNICISFKQEIAEMQMKEFGAKPLYGFDGKKEDWLPIEIFITYGGWLAPSQRRPEVVRELYTANVEKENQEGLDWLKSLEENPEEQALAVTTDYSSSDKILDNFKCLNNFEDETVLHYCTKQEMAEIAARYSGLDWLIGDEKNIRNLTADMAGFKSEKSQRVIIDYDKGYGRFLVRRMDMTYGAQEEEKDLEHRKIYKFEAKNDTKAEVKIEAKIEDLDSADLEEILHEFATCTHNFYLSLGKRIAGNV